MKLITSKEEWENYKNLLTGGFQVYHSGEPEKFPNFVIVDFQPNNDGPDRYYYEFIYVEDALELIKAQKEIYDKEPEKALEE